MMGIRKKVRKAIAKSRRTGRLRKVHAAAFKLIQTAINAIRKAKAVEEKMKGGSRKSWAELHNVESRLTRLK